MTRTSRGTRFFLLLQGPHGTDALGIHGGQDGIQLRMFLEHLQGGLVTVFQRIGESPGFRSDFLEPQFFQGFFVSLMPEFIGR